MKFLIDSTKKNFTPWWEREKSFDMFARRIFRYEKALKFCIGRASDIKPHVESHIKFLKRKFIEKFGSNY